MLIKKFGLKVLVGDLAIRKDVAHLIDNVCEIDQDQEEQETQHIRQTKNLVVDVTEQNINEFSIFDVVMPLMGHEVRLP